MRKIIRLFLVLVMSTALFAGCGSQEQELVSKMPFPEFTEADMEGDAITNDIFAEYDVTIVNFWNNGCGTCIAEMPELEEDNINLIGVGADSGESQEQLDLARSILQEKGVTYQNISPNPNNAFYKEFVADITGYPTTYIVDREGNIIGVPLIGNVKEQMETLQNRIDQIRESEKE